METRTAQPIIKSLSLATIVAALAGIVLLVLPFTDAFVGHSKTYLLFATGLLVTILFLVRVLKRNSFDIVLAPYTAPLALFGLSALASSFLTNAYPVENLLGMGGVYVAVVLIAILGGSLLPKHSAKTYLPALSIVGSVLLALAGLQLVGFGPAQWLNSVMGLNIPNGLIFNLSGSALISMEIALVGLVGIVSYYAVNRKLPNVLMATAPILLIAVVVFGWAILPGKETSITLPSYTASWSVALDAIRYPRSAIIGVGPANYGDVYNQFKPAWVNMQEYWNVPFNQAANTPLTILTTMGFVGLIAWLMFLAATLKMVKTVNKANKPLVWMVLAMLTFQLLLPTNVVMLAILGLTLAVLGAAERHKLPVLQLQALSARVTNQRKSNEYAQEASSEEGVITPFNAIAGLLLIGVLALSYFVGRTYAAHVYMNEANKAALQDNAVRTYELQQQAVELNPYLDVFRRRYATTNMLIAIALSNNAQEPTEQDTQQISGLLQQAIREARAATLLDQGDSQNWVTLAQIYEQMIGVSDEATQWAVQSYVNAIETNPMDPNLRIALGGIFLGQEQYAQAANIFNGAVQIKPDFANGYYNLAVALQNAGNLEQARSAYQQVLALIDPDTEDYTTVTAQLEELESAIAEASASAQAAGEAGLPTDGAGQEQDVAPSILDQNLQPQEQVINNSENLDLAEEETETDLGAIDSESENEESGDPAEADDTTTEDSEETTAETEEQNEPAE